MKTWMGLGILILAAGCGGGVSGDPKQPISGQITLDGKPLEAGSVTFFPADKGSPASADLADGRFAIDKVAGPTPGPYRVEIVAVRPTGKRVKSPDLPGETIDEVRNVIPQRYNVRTQLQVEVKSGEENRYSFDLTSREQPAAAKRRR